MSGSCHLDRSSNVEIGVECQIFVIVIFFNCGRVLQFGAHSRYYKGALTQKRSFLVICTTFRSDFHVGWKNQNKHSTLNSSFDTLSKWHKPDIRLISKTFYYRQLTMEMKVERQEFNPWDVVSIFDFTYYLYCCPECDWKEPSKQEFVNHALTYHPWVS